MNNINHNEHHNIRATNFQDAKFNTNIDDNNVNMIKSPLNYKLHIYEKLYGLDKPKKDLFMRKL